MQYDTFLRILDKIRYEAPDAMAARYRPDLSDIEKVNQARAPFFISI
ncbi:hypothetical protein [Comamonas sp.]|nr:hypothetical protein [Comamonas sp.]